MLLILFLLVTSLALKVFGSFDLGWIAEKYRPQWSVAKKLYSDYLLILCISGLLLLFALRHFAIDEIYADLYVIIGMFAVIIIIEKKSTRKV